MAAPTATPNANHAVVPSADAKLTGSPKAAGERSRDSHHDTTREIFETVVFVVVLVLMLKLFVAEAFVIPTGSMAPSLWGDQVRCTCRKCGHKFPINASENGHRVKVTTYVCENCGFDAHHDKEVEHDLSSALSGDRVLVSKYEYHLRDPRRFEIPVFRYPVEPFAVSLQDNVKDMQGMNYIKRLVGLGGETVAVFAGDLYTTRDLHYEHLPRDQRPQNPLDAWQFRYMYTKDEAAKDYFKQGKYEIVRKTPDEIMAVRRIVFDLDHQPEGPTGVHKTRWHPQPDGGEGWSMETAGFKHTGEAQGWVRYQHINPWNESTAPYYIRDCNGYNLRERNNDPFVNNNPFVDKPRTNNIWFADHWVSDLIVDCTAEISSPDSEVILEVAKGLHRYQAVFTKGECKLVEVTSVKDGEETAKPLGSQPTRLTKAGKFALRLANVDSRLTVWVDGKPLPFPKEQSDHAPPDPSAQFSPFDPNDLTQPARVGARGDVTCSKVSLWRDLHYNCSFPNPGRREEDRKKYEPNPDDVPSCNGENDWLQTYYVQPGHYLMFGDNTNSSADSRSWGLVPERLMLGRAVVIYWPAVPVMRVGVIE